ncbi:MAG: DUF1801 domain-containing protein [Gammaproteobacteria bacterium]|nr:DUF1801 domain-containing protein [Gammaproteobacteria bacterium]
MRKKPAGFQNPAVAAIFKAYPTSLRTKLRLLRQLIFNTAATTVGVGELYETLKWGQPSYLTLKSKSGSTLRIDQIKSQPGHYAMYVHCQTTLIEDFKEIYPDLFKYVGNRSIVFNVADRIPINALRHCIGLALTYHRNKKSSRDR